MWRRILPIIMVFSGFCNGNKDFSCSFHNNMWCGWYPSKAGNCDWKISEKNFHGDLGFIFLKADSNCHSRIQYTFSMWDNADPNYLNFEYYVLGPGPFTLSVSNDVEDYKINWGCKIQPGGQRREAHVKVTGIAKYININGNVRPGSCIIITRIWKDNKGKKIQNECPLITTPLSPTKRLTKSTIMPTTLKTPNNPISTLPFVSTTLSRPRFVSSKTGISRENDTSSTSMRFNSTSLVTWTIGTTETTPDETSPSETTPDESAPDETTPSETTPDESALDETTPSETTPDKSAPDETTPDETTPNESLTQKQNPTFSAIDDRTAPSSDLIQKKMATNWPKSTLVVKLVTGSNNISASFDKQTGVDKGKSKMGVVIGAVVGSVVLSVLFALIIFFFKRKRNTAYDLKPIL